MTGRAFALPVLLFNAFASAAMPVCTPHRKERHRGAQRPGEARRKSRSNTLIPSRSTAKIFPYFFPLQNFFPLTLIFACFKKPLKTLHFFTVIFRIFPISYNSNPGFSAKKKPCNFNGYRVFLMPIWGCFPLFFPLTDFFHAFLAVLRPSIKASMRLALSRFICSVTWPYTSRVKAAVWWPRFSCTVFISSPERIAATA